MNRIAPPPFRDLPPERSFVVQFSGFAPLGPENFCGRIEHIASGESLRFGSLEELYRFVSSLPRTSGARP